MNLKLRSHRTFFVPLGIALALASMSPMARGASILWTATGGTWLTASTWTGSVIPAGTDVAQFGVNPTSTASSANAGINFNTAGTNNGTQNQQVGAIEVTSARTNSLAIGDSSSTVGKTGTLTLNGVTVNGVADTVIRNNSSFTVAIQNTVGSGNQGMDVALNDATNNIINIDSSGGVTISTILKNGTSAASSAKNLTLNGNSTGILTLSGTGVNTYSGATTVNVGELDLNKSAANGAIAGNLVVGDGVGSANTAVTKLLASDQIANGSSVTVNSDGKFDIVAQSDTVGAVTLAGGTITGTTGVLTGSSYGVQSGTISGHLAGSGALTKTTAGTVVLSSSATYTGGTNINGGTLQLTANNVLPDTGTVSMGGGTLQLVSTQEGTTGAAGAGALALTSSSIIDLSGTDLIHFLASNGQTWTGTLSIYNWTGTPVTGGGAEQILFGTDTTALTLAQLNQISFYSNAGTTFLGTAQFATANNGEIVPFLAAVPEPSTWLAGALVFGTLLVSQRRRLLRKATP